MDRVYAKIENGDLFEIDAFDEARRVPLLYNDDLIAVYGYGKVSVKNNEKLSLCDNLDYKNDIKSLFVRIGGESLYKLTGEHLDQIRGKLVQIPHMFKLDDTKDVLIADCCLLEGDNLLCLWLCSPLFIWFKNCKFTKVENTNYKK